MTVNGKTLSTQAHHLLSLELLQASTSSSSHFHSISNPFFMPAPIAEIGPRVSNGLNTMTLESLLNVINTTNSSSTTSPTLEKINSMISTVLSDLNNESGVWAKISMSDNRANIVLPSNTVLPIAMLSNPTRVKVLDKGCSLVEHRPIHQSTTSGADFVSTSIATPHPNAVNPSSHYSSSSNLDKRPAPQSTEPEFDEILDDGQEHSDNPKKTKLLANLLKSGIKVLQKVAESLE